MLEGKLIIIPALGHQNKGKSSFTGSGLFVLMSQRGNNNELALQHVLYHVIASCKRPISCPPLVRSSFVHRTRSWPSGDDSTDLSDFFCVFLCLALVLANPKFPEFFEYQGE